MVVNNPEKKKAKFLGVGVALEEGTLRLPQLFFLQKSSSSKKRWIYSWQIGCKPRFFERQPERKQPRFHPRALPQHCLSRWKKGTSFDCNRFNQHQLIIETCPRLLNYYIITWNLLKITIQDILKPSWNLVSYAHFRIHTKIVYQKSFATLSPVTVVK